MELTDPNMQTVEEIEKELTHQENSDITDPKKKKFVALYQARTVLSHIGTMAERRMARTQLKRMKNLG